MIQAAIELLFSRRQGNYHPSADPPRWMLGAGSQSKAGVAVTEESAKSLAAFYCGLTVYCNTFASLPLITYKRTSEDGRERAVNQSIYLLLHERPNPFMTPSEFKEMLIGHLLLRGDFFAKIVSNNGGIPAELIPLNPDQIDVAYEELGEFGQSGIWGLTYKNNDERDGRKYPPWAILHVKGLGSNGLRGQSIIEAGREVLGRNQAVDEHASEFFANNSVPLGVLQYPQALEDEDITRIRRDWESQHRGSGRRHRIAVLEEGLTWQNLGMTNQDAQFLENRRFEIEELARILNLPPQKLKDYGRATWNNFEHAKMDFYEDSITPFAVRIEEGISRCLLTEKERKKYFVQFLIEARLRGDTKTRYSCYGQAIKDGWMSRNEVRRRENMNPEEGLNEFLEPLNMAPAGEREEQPAIDSNSILEKLFPVIEYAAERCTSKEAGRLRSAAKKPRLEASKYLRSFYDKHAEFMREAFAPVAQTAEDLGLSSAADAVRRWIDFAVKISEDRVYACFLNAEFTEPLQTFAADMTARTCADGCVDFIARAIDE